LINHNQEKTLTFDEAQLFAINKAIEIGKIDFLRRHPPLAPLFFSRTTHQIGSLL
jgi:hypothetical protein